MILLYNPKNVYIEDVIYVAKKLNALMVECWSIDTIQLIK